MRVACELGRGFTGAHMREFACSDRGVREARKEGIE